MSAFTNLSASFFFTSTFILFNNLISITPYQSIESNISIAL
jgi:hypothetical protein